jgi:predicted nucleic acid-binding protein
LFRTKREETVERIIREVDLPLHVPALCDVEIAATVRRGVRRRLLSLERAGQVIEDYLDLPISRHGHQTLLVRILDLRENFTAYDASYVALAEELGASLVTSDESLGRAVRTHTSLETTLI